MVRCRVRAQEQSEDHQAEGWAQADLFLKCFRATSLETSDDRRNRTDSVTCSFSEETAAQHECLCINPKIK